MVFHPRIQTDPASGVICKGTAKANSEAEYVSPQIFLVQSVPFLKFSTFENLFLRNRA